MKELVKIIVFVPVTHANILRETIGKAGGGKIGNYSDCSFSSRGVGRFKPGLGAKPAIGRLNKLEEVEEERIEVTCEKSQVKIIAEAIRQVHPYEEVALDIYPLITFD